MSNFKYKIGFRVDGDSKIGIGHIMRCLALASELYKMNCEIFFITTEEHEIITNKGFSVIKIDSELINGNGNFHHEISLLLNIIKELKIECIIVDHYYVSLGYLEKLKVSVKILTVIDDFCDNRIPADIILNGNIYADKNNYTDIDPSTILLIGSRYTLFREEFLKLPKRIVNHEVQDVLITTGGSDNHNLTLKLLEIAINSDLVKDLNINIIIGHMFTNTEEIQTFSKKFDNIKLFYNVSNMSELMLRNDIALTTSGVTLYELAITGTPSISFIVANNQERLARKMDELHCTINLGQYNLVSDEKIKKTLKKLIFDTNSRKQISQIAQNLFDGKGAFRSAQKIIKSLK